MMICMGIWVIGHPGITLGKELATSNLLGKKAGEVGEVNTPSTLDNPNTDEIKV
jgi:hypothetical protein